MWWDRFVRHQVGLDTRRLLSGEGPSALVQSRSRNSSAVKPAWRRIDVSVPGRTSSCSGTITIRDGAIWRNLQWLPRVLTTSKPTFSSARTTRLPDTTGSWRGLTPRAGPRSAQRSALEAPQEQVHPRSRVQALPGGWPAPPRCSALGSLPLLRRSEPRTSHRQVRRSLSASESGSCTKATHPKPGMAGTQPRAGAVSASPALVQHAGGKSEVQQWHANGIRETR